ncbi:MAG: hypothetical protein ABIH42_05470, partial [Planctomycetota bacterium]
MIIKKRAFVIFLIMFLCYALLFSGCKRDWSSKKDGIKFINYNFDISRRANDQRAPVCAYNSVNDEYIIVWDDYRSGVDHDIYASVIDRISGDYIFSEICISAAINEQTEPSVAFNPIAKEYLIVWEDKGNGVDYDIYGQFVSSTYGTLIGPNFLISGVISYDERAPKVLYNSVDNNYLVVW